MDFSILEILSQRFVKPSTSTPPSLRYHELSLNDQIQQEAFIPLSFFYPSNPIRSTIETSQILEISLSRTLSYYYPFAGRIRDNLFIECNDKGVDFTEARIKCEMTEFNKNSKSPLKGIVFPSSLLSSCNDNDDDSASLLKVQFNYFNCGGIAMTICMSHKLGDLSTLLTFFHDWAAMVVESNHIPSPKFIDVSLFPPTPDPSLLKEMVRGMVLKPAKNLLFRGNKIAELKKMVATASGVENPTRVEVVTALLYKCALISSREILGSFSPAGLVIAMNLRSMTVPPLPEEAVGNISVGLAIETPTEDEITLPELVLKLRNTKVNIKNEYIEAKTNTITSVKLAKDQLNQIAMSNLDLYFCTSWCRFPVYDVDFGNGKPVRVYFPDQGGGKNCFILRDTLSEEDGIEVLAVLEEPQMSAFVANEELLAFASLAKSW